MPFMKWASAVLELSEYCSSNRVERRHRIFIIALSIVDIANVVLRVRRKIRLRKIFQIVAEFLQREIILCPLVVAEGIGVSGPAAFQQVGPWAPASSCPGLRNLGRPRRRHRRTRMVLIRFCKSAIFASSLPIRVFMSSTDSRTARKSSAI